MFVGMERETKNGLCRRPRLRVTPAERARHLSNWELSGQSARDYAAAHGLRAGNLYAWSAKARSVPVPVPVPVSASAPGTTAAPTDLDSSVRHFVPLRVASEATPPSPPPLDSGLRVTLRRGEFECSIDGAGSAERCIELAAKLKRMVLDV